MHKESALFFLFSRDLTPTRKWRKKWTRHPIKLVNRIRSTKTHKTPSSNEPINQEQLVGVPIYTKREWDSFPFLLIFIPLLFFFLFSFLFLSSLLLLKKKKKSLRRGGGRGCFIIIIIIIIRIYVEFLNMGVSGVFSWLGLLSLMIFFSLLPLIAFIYTVDSYSFPQYPPSLFFFLLLFFFTFALLYSGLFGNGQALFSRYWVTCLTRWFVIKLRRYYYYYYFALGVVSQNWLSHSLWKFHYQLLSFTCVLLLSLCFVMFCFTPLKNPADADVELKAAAGATDEDLAALAGRDKILVIPRFKIMHFCYN